MVDEKRLWFFSDPRNDLSLKPLRAHHYIFLKATGGSKGLLCFARHGTARTAGGLYGNGARFMNWAAANERYLSAAANWWRQSRLRASERALILIHCGEEAVLISGKLCQTFCGIFKYSAYFVFIHESRVSFTNEAFVIGELIWNLASRFIKSHLYY